MKSQNNKSMRILIIFPVIIILLIAIYYFYTSYIGYTPTQRLLNAEQTIILLSMLIVLLSLLFLFTIRHIFSQIDRDDETLNSMLKHINIDPRLKKKFALKKILSEQNRTEIYHVLKKVIQNAEENKEIAQKANASKSRFLANMSHEIRTPLNGIVGFTDLLKSSGLNSEQHEFIQVIEKSSENLLSVIDDILDLSKIESGKIDIEEIEFDPILEFESGIESYGAKAAEKNINLGFYIDPALSAKLNGDSNKIKQVLVNLISNAVKFTPDGGNIDILIQKVYHSDDVVTVLFSVKDSGIGVSPEQKKKIFEAFSQADSSTSKKFGGTGLGLTISKKLVDLMGGELDLKSETGEGSTFFFSLKFQELQTETEIEKFEDLTIGYYLPCDEHTEQSDIYVKKYISVLNPKYKLFDTIESLILLKEDKQPDLLFLSFNHIDNTDLIQLSRLKSKISLLAATNQKDEIKALHLDFFKTLYSPINFSKIKGSLLDFKKINIHKDIDKNEKNKFNNIKALIVEDNPVDQQLIKLTLENFGISVTLTNDGQEAFNLRHTEEFDIIFMDIQMPIMNGIETTRSILYYEHKNKLKHIPIVALTASALKGDKERFIALGMDQYLSKPIKVDAIEHILDRYFKNDSIVENTLPKQKKTRKKESVDILLCKKEEADMLIFYSLLKELGYSVDRAENIAELKEMIQYKNYTHVLLDKKLEGLTEDNEIHKMMKKLAIKSILFVENRDFVSEEEYQHYTRVILNIPNLKFLDHNIKLNLRELRP